MSPDIRRDFGNRGEDLAALYLKDKGYKILASQYTTRRGEIDLVCQDKDEIVFVEVKTRRSKIFGYPEESVTPKKLEKIAHVAQLYLQEYKQEDAQYRIDVIAIEIIDNSEPVITHFTHV